MAKSVTSNERTMATIAYLTFVGTIIAFFMNIDKRSEFVKFHIRQMFGLIIILFIANAIGPFSQITGDILWVLAFLLWAFGLFGAITKKELPVPIIGIYFQQWFTFL